jgi:hypothetical protein
LGREENPIIGESLVRPRRDESPLINGCDVVDFNDLENSASQADDLGQADFLVTVVKALPILHLPRK